MSGTVTALELQKKNKDRVNVYLDGEFAFGLPAIEAARLRKGQLLSDSEIAELKDRDELARATDRAMHFLSYRPRSIAEIRRNLVEKEIAEAVIDAVLARLQELGYADDLAFARFWIGNRQEFKPLGTRALRFELREKGVPNPVIDEALADVNAHEAAYRAIQEKARRMAGQDRRSVRTRLGAFLSRRGFDYETARQAVDRALEELDAENVGIFEQSDDDTDTNWE